ncbi:hypothetical protein BGV60_03490 [Burkholderia ubonensis]|nr:hypothetical protein BGV60_03490 [Burkholderia ubonensis]
MFIGMIEHPHPTTVNNLIRNGGSDFMITKTEREQAMIRADADIVIHGVLFIIYELLIILFTTCAVAFLLNFI